MCVYVCSYTNEQITRFGEVKRRRKEQGGEKGGI